MESASTNAVDEAAEQLQDIHTTDNKEQAVLELPILVGEYKKPPDVRGLQISTNQIRMHLTASAKFLEAVGISGIPVYGIQIDGPIASISASVVKKGVCIPIKYVLMSVDN